MKVVCINDKDINPHRVKAQLPNGPVVYGETYTVIGTDVSNNPICDGELIYYLEEKPIIVLEKEKMPSGWWGKRFVSLEYFEQEFNCEKELVYE